MFLTGSLERPEHGPLDVSIPSKRGYVPDFESLDEHQAKDNIESQSPRSGAMFLTKAPTGYALW